jgi:16S rRNA (guanine527-N7)-methyltransferase
MTPAERRSLTTAAADLGVELDATAASRVGSFVAVLDVWNRRLRLTGERDRSVLLEKHVVDCFAVVPRLPRAGMVVDIGSGAGFPGIILACVRPDLDVVLIESRRRPVSFLREAIRKIGLEHARVLEARAEDAGVDTTLAGRASVVTTRAVRLEVFVTIAMPLLTPAGEAIAMQTPRTARDAASVATTHGLQLVGRDDYRLPDGAARSLLRFRRAEVP